MEVIQSFTIDHTRLKPGIYVSREDKGFTTFDLRITEPNKEPAVAPAAMHSLEHLMATWFRNSEAKEDVAYVGPMGTFLRDFDVQPKWWRPSPYYPYAGSRASPDTSCSLSPFRQTAASRYASECPVEGVALAAGAQMRGSCQPTCFAVVCKGGTLGSYLAKTRRGGENRWSRRV